MGKKKTLREQVRHQASDLADTLAPRVEAAREKAGPVLAEAREKAAPVLAEAREKAAPVLAEAREKAAPFVSEARDKAAPLVSEARDKITTEMLPAVTAAIATLDEATHEAREESKKRGKAAVAALRGEVEAPKKKHRGRKLLILFGLGGLIFAVSRILGKRQPTTNWQSSYTPPPAPTPSPAGGPVADTATGTTAGAHRADTGDDEAASDPAEAASDATDVPHDASTPDNPVEEVDVNKQ